METRMRVVAAAFMAACITIAVGCGLGAPASVPPGHTAAVVLLSGPNRLVTVDLHDRRIVADVPLRSLALDVAVDRWSGLAVTAQCGGIGNAADDAAGVYDVRDGGPVSYVPLPRANPGVVACVGGRAYVEHGVYEDGGLFVSVVDPVRRRVVRTGRAPDGPGVRMVPGPRGLRLLAAAGDDTLRLMSMSPSDLSTRAVADVPAGTTALGQDGYGGLALFGGGAAARSDDAPWYAEVREGDTRTVEIPIPGLASVGLGCMTTRHALAAEGDGPASASGRRLAVLERGSGRPAGAIVLPGSVAAVCPWGERALVVTLDPCRLAVVDPARLSVVFEVDLGSDRMLGADVDVLPADGPRRGVSGPASP